jgi:uncharacterized protein (DUF342 family)
MNQKNREDFIAPEDLDNFLDKAQNSPESDRSYSEEIKRRVEPDHRRLRVMVTQDRQQAYLEAVFPSTTYHEIKEALKRENILYNLQEETIQKALEKAGKTGRRQRDVLVAQGKPAVYIKRKEVRYPVLENIRDPESGEPLHLASSVFREISEVLSRADIERIRGYALPVLAVQPQAILMEVQGLDEIESGMDVLGNVIHKVQNEGPGSLKAGDGVAEEPNGMLVAKRYGYLAIVHRYISVISPIWISPEKMEAYFFNPPQLGNKKAPNNHEVMRELKSSGVCFGIEEANIAQMCRDLTHGNLRESCVRIAKGERPNLNKGQIAFTFDPIPPARFEGVLSAFRSLKLEDVLACETGVLAVREGAVLAEQVPEGGAGGVGKNIFGQTVAPSETEQEKKVYKAGLNVKKETRKGLVCYIAEVYGYAGIIGNQICVISPIWIPPDRMEAYFVVLNQTEGIVSPTANDVSHLLEVSQVRYGIDQETIASLCQGLKDGSEKGVQCFCVAKGIPPEPGQDGNIELLFKRLPDPGTLLEDGAIDFRERDAVPNVEIGHLLARRLLPSPGKPGINVRGREIHPPKTHRELLYAGPNVVVKEEENAQLFYATQPGFARVVKDTLSVLQRLRYQGDVNYKLGNIQFEGDVEIGGTVKSRFKVQATGDVYVDGTVENRAEIIAGGDVVVRGGIIGGKVQAKGSIFAKFIQDAEIIAGQDLLVRNYVRDSKIRVGRKATLQGNDGGERQICLVGGQIEVGMLVEAASVGTKFGRKTHIVVGFDWDTELRLVRYQKGLAFCETRSRQAMRSLMATTKGKIGKTAIAEALKEASGKQKEFLIEILKELQELDKLRVSIEHYISDLKQAQQTAAQQAQIRVTGAIFSNVYLQIGNAVYILGEDTEAAVFRLDQVMGQITKELLR